MTGTEGPFHDPEPDSRAPHAQRPAVPEIAAQEGSSGTIRRRDASHGEERRSPAGVVSTSGGEDPESLLDAIRLTTDRIRTGALGRVLVRAAQLSHIHARCRDLCNQGLDLGVVLVGGWSPDAQPDAEIALADEHAAQAWHGDLTLRDYRCYVGAGRA